MHTLTPVVSTAFHAKHRLSRGRACAAACVVGLACSLSACGGVYYAAEINGATGKLEEARVLGAETLAPYEYYYAKEHLEAAQIEAAEASYSDAANFAETAEEYAQKAVQLAQAAHRAAGRP